MKTVKFIIRPCIIIILLSVYMTSCKSDPKTPAKTETPPVKVDKTINATKPSQTDVKAYEVKIDPSSLCYQEEKKGDVLQLRYTADGSRIKGVYNNLTKQESNMRTGVITGFISNNKINAVYSYRDGGATKRQGLVIETFENHIILTHPDENNRTVKLPLIDCGGFKR